MPTDRDAKIHQLCIEVEEIVKDSYGYDDGADLAYEMLISGDLSHMDSAQYIAAKVAQRIEQQ